MDNKIINNIKSLAIDMISNAESGHPGIVLSAAPIIYTLYMNHMNVNKDDPNWYNRDRFVLSAGHGSALLYSTLFMCGYDISLNDLKTFRRAYSNTPGHPEVKITPGIDTSTGPLGQGLGNAVGMALAAKIMGSRHVISNTKNKIDDVTKLVDYKVYVLCGDGDLMEGISYEAASLAGTLKLNNLIILYDSNDISLDGRISNTFKENVLDRFESMGWNVQHVKNGNDVSEIDKAISRAKGSRNPTIIEIKTILGNGSALQNTNKVHGSVLEQDDVQELKKKLDIPEESFYFDEDLKKVFTDNVYKRGLKKYNKWVKNSNEYINTVLKGSVKKFDELFNAKINLNILDKFKFPEQLDESTRETNHKIINKLVTVIPSLIGGSADVASSTKTYLDNCGDISAENYDGKNIWFGVREHAMGAILNGLALSNLRPFGSTFLVFSDYVKPAVRMSALMNLPVTYIFTHDSIYVGKDGPTHQPIEQLSMLRNIPNFNVYRPADAHELVGCWNEILSNSKPCALILTRGKVKLLDNTDPHQVCMGAYIVRKEESRLNGIIIATGSEVQLALSIAEELYEERKLDIRVVSMPSQATFLKQSKQYQEEILPIGYKKIVVEAGSSFGWHRFVYNENYLITVDKFGISGSEEDVKKYFKFDYDTIKNKISKLL